MQELLIFFIFVATRSNLQTPEHILSKRLIFHHLCDLKNDTVVFTGGIHGNEHAGILALHQVFVNDQLKLNANVYALAGNMKALSRNLRFIDTDMNRLWTFENTEGLPGQNSSVSEMQEMESLKAEFFKIIEKHGHRKITFIDLHTTSSVSCPFIPFNDSLRNRYIAQKFPLPLILGIEEYIQGAMTTYINDLNHVAFAFEAGQHQDPNSIELHSIFIKLCLYHLGMLDENPQDFRYLTKKLKSAIDIPSGFYEISYHHHLRIGEEFVMTPGYKNFQPVKKGELLAIQNEKQVLSPQKGRIFMPSYQKLSLDGFFIINRVSHFWLLLSKSLRNLKLANLLPLLPGIKPHPLKQHIYIVNPEIVKFLHKEVFHLLGYRILPSQNNCIEIIRRDL